MKKMCIFDLDGTLINSLPAISHFANLALNSIGLDSIDIDTYRYYVGDGMDTLLHRCLNHFGADNDENFAKIRPVYKSGYDSDVLFETYPYEGINELLHRLKDMGIKLCVLSNKPDNAAVDAVVSLFGEDLFDIIIGQKDSIAKKPVPDGVFMICDKMNISPEDTVFIGDTNVDIRTAKASGAYSVGVLWGFRDEKELIDAGSDKIVTQPSEILEIFEVDYGI